MDNDNPIPDFAFRHLHREHFLHAVARVRTLRELLDEAEFAVEAERLWLDDCDAEWLAAFDERQDNPEGTITQEMVQQIIARIPSR